MLFDIQILINLTQVVTNHNPKLSLLLALKQILAQKTSCHQSLTNERL